MIFPEMPKQGDTIMLIAPSSPLKPEQEYTMEGITAGFEKMGFRVREGKSCRAKTRKGYAAAAPEVKVADIHEAFGDDEVKAVWAIRGGSMGAEMMPLLDFDLIRRHPKVLFGFSDVTSLHMALHEKCGLMTVHGPNGTSFHNYDAEKYSFRRLKALLEMGDTFELINPEDKPIRVYREGSAEGTLVGGNLSLISQAVGTPYGLNTEGKILFLEDVGENMYHLNQMLIQMKYNGMFKGIKGVLLGDFTDCKNEYTEEYTAEDLLDDFFADFEVPVYRSLSVGHIKDNAAIPLGMTCVMKEGRVMFEKR